jgi:hypothetical protein
VHADLNPSFRLRQPKLVIRQIIDLPDDEADRVPDEGMRKKESMRADDISSCRA